VIVSVEVPVVPAVRGIVFALRETVGPEGEREEVNDIGPLKPLMLATVIVELAEEPGRMMRLLGLADMVKSRTACTVATIVTERESRPL